MKHIPLTQGKVALVDDADFQHLSQWKWHAVKTKDGRWYAVRSEGRKPFQKTIRMHRQIMNVTDPRIEVDHRNGNGLINQRYNLRKCTNAQNSANRKKNPNNSSGYKGVYWNKAAGKWHAQIMVSYKRIHLGMFERSEDAARAYDEAAIKHFGPFAKLNFPR